MATVVETFSTPGTYTWICPSGVTSVKVECWGGGGGGGGGDGVDSSSHVVGGCGGGGGEYAAETTLTVVPGNSYTIIVGTGGTGGNPLATGTGNDGVGHAGTNSSFNGAATTVTAHAGAGGTLTVAGTGGTGSTNTVHHNGGTGGICTVPDGSGPGGGGGGGGSGGTSTAGNNGGSTNSTAAGIGAAAVPGGGAGGSGGSFDLACVDTQTEIYTRRGWLTYDQLLVGDETLSFDPVTATSVWTPVLRVNVHPGNWDLIQLQGAGFSAATNATHRWLVLSRGEQVWRTTDSLDPDDLIPTPTDYVEVSKVTRVTYILNGVIWCPTTGNGTWLARRDGHEYFTGNKP